MITKWSLLHKLKLQAAAVAVMEVVSNKINLVKGQNKTEVVTMTSHKGEEKKIDPYMAGGR